MSPSLSEWLLAKQRIEFIEMWLRAYTADSYSPTVRRITNVSLGNSDGAQSDDIIKLILTALRQEREAMRAASIALVQSTRPSGECRCDWCAWDDWYAEGMIDALQQVTL